MNVASTLLESFSPLRVRDFRVYLGGQAISLVGTWLQVTAQGWAVWVISRSTSALGIAAMLSTLPILLLGRWTGVWADRLDRRRLLIATATGAMALAFVLASLVQTNRIQLWHLYLLSALLGIVTAIDLPAQQAFLGDLSGMGQVRRAVNLNTMIVQVSRMVGPAMAGFVIASLGTATAFWLNGLSFVAVIASLLAVRSNQVQTARSDGSAGGFGEGLRFVAGQPRIQDLMIFVVLITFLVFPVLNILPAFATGVLRGDAQTLGILLASSGAGALTGTLFVVPIAQTIRRTGAVVGTAVVWMGVWAIIFSTTTWLPLSVVSMFFVSLGAPAVFTMVNGLLQFLAPPEMRARLLSLLLMVSFGLQPFASLLIGYSAELLSTPVAIEINGILLLTGAAAMFALRPKLLRWEVNPPAGETNGSA
ncbi:MAG TPA: MFS transporter [Candidatus Bathyarchaeia archaeon]